MVHCVFPYLLDLGIGYGSSLPRLWLPLTGVRTYYTPENLAKTTKIRWPGVRAADYNSSRGTISLNP